MKKNTRKKRENSRAFFSPHSIMVSVFLLARGLGFLCIYTIHWKINRFGVLNRLTWKCDIENRNSFQKHWIKWPKGWLSFPEYSVMLAPNQLLNKFEIEDSQTTISPLPPPPPSPHSFWTVQTCPPRVDQITYVPIMGLEYVGCIKSIQTTCKTKLNRNNVNTE